MTSAESRFYVSDSDINNSTANFIMSVSSPLGTQLRLIYFLRTGLIISDDWWGVCEDLPIHREWQVILTQSFCLQKLCGECTNCCLFQLQSGRQTLQQEIGSACILSRTGQECSNPPPPQGNFTFICQMRRTVGGKHNV